MFHNMLKILNGRKVFFFIFVNGLNGGFLIGGMLIFNLSLQGAYLAFFLLIHQGLQMFGDESPTLLEELSLERWEVGWLEEFWTVHCGMVQSKLC
jgi:hypothetical protein